MKKLYLVITLMSITGLSFGQWSQTANNQTQGAIKLKNYLLFDADGDFTGGNYYTIQDHSSGDYLRFGYGFNDHLILSSTGNVGIGTTVPTYAKLHLKQEAGDAVFKIENTGNGNASIIKFSRERSTSEDQVGGAIGLVSNTNNVWSQLFLNARSAQAHVGVDGSGTQTPFLTIGDGFSNNVAVGIGTTTPKNALDVVGTIRSTEVKVEATPWPDFVFEKDYELKTLEEVEDFVAENKHLPEIPSEVDVNENGINLGEMDSKLLLKIEELTLYMIDMNKRMGKLENENTELKKEVSALKNE